MPLYDYECSRCGHQFEARRALGARPPRCPKCRGGTKKRFSPVPVVFRGTGWHSTDYGPYGPKSRTPAKDGKAESGSDGTAPKEPKKSVGTSKDDD